MSETRGREHVVLTVDPHAASEPLREAVGRTFDILVIGDFSGGGRGAQLARERPEDRSAIRVRSVDDVLARLRPSVELDVGGVATTLEFHELEDFHPDRLLRAVPALRALVDEPGRGAPDAPGPEPGDEARPRPPASTSADEARPSPPVASGDEARPSPPASGSGDEGRPAAGLLDDIVADAPEQAPSRDSPALEDLRPWLRDVVAPYLREGAAAAEAGSEGRAEAASAHVRDVLHHPAVHALERAWRSLFLLLRAVDPVEEARLHLLDISRAELEALLAGGEAGSAQLRRILDEAPAGGGSGAPVALLVMDQAFGPDPADVLLLNRLAMTAHELGAPLLAEAGPGLLGMGSFREVPPAGRAPEPTPAWSAFRATQAAESVALLAPGVLLREPYGPSAEPCETFDFDEVDEGENGPYLWGSPAFIAAAAAVEALAAEGWDLTLESPREVDGMPIHVTATGAVGAHPTEAVWPLDVVEHAMAAGVNPVIGFKGQTRVRLPGVSSASTGRAPLRSWWSR